jgi:hypothetical protein
MRVSTVARLVAQASHRLHRGHAQMQRGEESSSRPSISSPDWRASVIAKRDDLERETICDACPPSASGNGMRLYGKFQPTSAQAGSKAARRASMFDKSDHSTKPFAVYCRRAHRRRCLFGRYATQREAEAATARLYNVGCVVFTVAGANAPIGWRELQQRTREAVDTVLDRLAPKRRIDAPEVASEVAAELRSKHPDIASGWFEFETSVAALLRLRLRR